MRRSIITIIIMIAFAAVIKGQDFDSMKICVNPGHGGHDSDDRYIAATGFWESEGNLTKGLYLRDMLEAHNAVVIMTRVLNRTEDDLSLSTIRAIANNNNVDWLHSIHSNGHQGTANYSLLIYRGATDDTPTHPEAKVMGGIMVDEIWKALRTTAKYNRADYPFLTYYLGVLNGTNMPATLSEGSFHDYIPESWRLKNDSYLKHESWAIFRSFLSYYSLGNLPHGIVAGILRDSETDVSYYYISSTNDRRKPINNITVTLNPGGRVYNGDNYNNGFYMFDSVAPGNYWVVFEANNFHTDSVQVTVTANNTVFADKWMQYDTTIASYITNYSPNTADSVFATTSIVVNFSREMNKTSVENAFLIDPAATGNFSWSNGNRTLTFTPTVPYEKATRYTVTITTDAKSKWNTPIDSNFVFDFVTFNRNKLNFESSYPSAGKTGISPTVRFRLVFDAPVVSPAGYIRLKNSADQTVALKDPSTETLNGKGLVYFEPNTPLALGETFTLHIDSAYKDIGDNLLKENIQISFTTSNTTYTGTVIEPFETLGGWKNASYSGSSVNIEPTTSLFEITNTRKYNGTNSGRVSCYYTNPTGGIARYFNANKPSIGSTPTDFGIWIFGDLSMNFIEYWFYYSSTTNTISFADTINWTGWKFIRVPGGSIGGSGERLFHSIVIKQNPNGAMSSIIYVDDAMYNTNPVGDIDDQTGAPKAFALHQNYPNPFNPSTFISFSLPKETNVRLHIFDILGRSVRTLVDDAQYSPGIWRVEWDGKDNFGKIVPSGVYIYRIEANEIIQSKKMMMLK